MFKKIKKITKDVRGFTLTEVMIGMMILTVAIVSASNLLTGIIDSNRNNLTTMQAYYLSQEGLEMVRNIRDTNWLHNRGWLGKDSDPVWGEHFAVPESDDGVNTYAVNIVDAIGKTPGNETGLGSVGAASPWKIESNGVGKIYRHGENSLDKPFLDFDASVAKDSGFKRTILIKKYKCDYLPNGLCPDKNVYALVQSRVEWDIGAKHRELVLSQVLANWKGGAL
ncbi:prepilin-type N-terminal cleavage/methylation domain-containing protein [Candidatus Peregrinibacteria bacterium]|nr:prepilin-type N-terminal cleavage/methylation domain-containing protein [Candidatus Peregrinibacteria bacterium]